MIRLKKDREQRESLVPHRANCNLELDQWKSLHMGTTPQMLGVNIFCVHFISLHLFYICLAHA